MPALQAGSAGFARNARFRNAEYFCSAGQAARAEMYALAWGIPLAVTVSESHDAVRSEQFHGSGVTTMVLTGLARAIDPYGEGVLTQVTKDRIPEDGERGTVSALLAEYADLPWYSSPAEQ